MSLQLLASAGAPFDPLLPLVIVPMVGVLVLAFVPAARRDSYKLLALLFSGLTGAIAIQTLVQFDTADAGFQFVKNWTWSEELGINFHIGIDGISLWMVVLTGLLFPIAIAAVNPEKEPKSFYMWLLMLQAGSMGVFIALDLVLFFVFFEIVLVPMYFLIGLWGHGDRIYAATKFFIYTMVGSALMLVGILATGFLHQRATGTLTFDVVELANSQSLSTTAARWIFASFALAFAVKVPLFPVHTWLPDAHTEAPTTGSVILAGVMLKLGAYGLIRFGLYLFPEASQFFRPLLLTVAVIGIVYGAACATMQKDLKRLVAYSSVAHMGFIILGIFSFTRQGIGGGVLQMLNHGITTPALFILVGLIYERRHTREIAELNGLQKVAPIFAGVFMLVMLSSVGLPGLNGFPGEFLTLIGGFKGARWWAVVAATGTILASLYLLWAYQRVFHGEPSEDNKSFAELKLSEGIGLLPLLVLIVALGVYPKPLLERIEPSVDRLLEHMGAHAEGIDVSDVDVPALAANDAGQGEEGGH